MLLGILAPILLLEWVGAAALPCAVMGVDGAGASTHAQASEIAPIAHHDAHTDHASTDMGQQHAACPHCARAPAAKSGDAQAHAACGDTPASTTSEVRRSSTQPDLSLAAPVQVEPYAALPTPGVFVTLDSGGVPPTKRALYLRHCVFLN